MGREFKQPTPEFKMRAIRSVTAELKVQDRLIARLEESLEFTANMINWAEIAGHETESEFLLADANLRRLRARKASNRELKAAETRRLKTLETKRRKARQLQNEYGIRNRILERLKSAYEHNFILQIPLQPAR